MDTLVIVGAGPGLGLSLAKKFGLGNFKVALIARRQQKLNEYVSILKKMQIDAEGFKADVSVEHEIQNAFDGIRHKFGEIDVLIYNAAIMRPVSAAQTTAELASKHLQVNLLGGISCAQQVISEMTERKQGSILFTGGGQADLFAIPFLTTLSISKSGLRSYAHCLHDELSKKGVFVGMLTITGMIKEGTSFSPDHIAEAYYDMYVRKDTVETFYS
jgi:short-subunit dehydrogenase